MRVLGAVSWCALGLAFCQRLPAPLIPEPNLAERIEHADAIVVAKVTSGTSTTSGSEVSSDFTLHVERVFKGDLIAGTDVPAHLEGREYGIVSEPRPTSIHTELYGIWFLSTAKPPYTVLSRDGKDGAPYLAPVILPESAPPGEPARTPAASVANEIASALRWTAAANSKDAKGRLYSLLDDFRSLHSSATLSIYKQFAADPSPAVRAIGIQGLIAANDPEGVKRAAADWRELAAAADVNPIINSLMSYSNANDAEAVRALGTLALRDHPESGLRENAVYALRAIHTKEALPALVALLDQQNDRVRPYALSGLCLFVRNAPPVTPQSVPSMSWLEIRKPTPLLNPDTERYCLLGGSTGPAGDLDTYVSFWKTWWSEHRPEIERP